MPELDIDNKRHCRVTVESVTTATWTGGKGNAQQIPKRESIGTGHLTLPGTDTPVVDAQGRLTLAMALYFGAEGYRIDHAIENPTNRDPYVGAIETRNGLEVTTKSELEALERRVARAVCIPERTPSALDAARSAVAQQTNARSAADAAYATLTNSRSASRDG